MGGSCQGELFNGWQLSRSSVEWVASVKKLRLSRLPAPIYTTFVLN